MKHLRLLTLILVVLLLSMIPFVAQADEHEEEEDLFPLIGELVFTEDGDIVFITVDEVPYAFAEAETGGFVTVNENGAFKLQPRGGIPTVMLKPGVYTIEAIGDKGSRATTPLEVLEKKQ